LERGFADESFLRAINARAGCTWHPARSSFAEKTQGVSEGAGTPEIVNALQGYKGFACRHVIGVISGEL
jgi:hypothetical protein